MDNIKASIQTDFIKYRNKTNFRESIDTGNGNISLRLKDKPIGLEYLNIKNNNISLSANARLLKENYKQGFCLDTLDQLTDILKDCGLHLNSDYVQQSNLSLAHVKNDILVNTDEVFLDLALVQNNKFNKVQRENSLTLESVNKGDKMTTIFYSKHMEMTKINKPKYKGLGINTDDFIGITRMETKYNDWRTVKKYLGTRNFLEILKQENINYITLNNILKGQSMETPKLDLMQFKSIAELNDYAITKLLYEECNGNETAIRRQIKNLIGRNTKPTYQMNKIKKNIPLIQSPEGRKLESLINMKEQLKK